jgi:hypothetical protein
MIQDENVILAGGAVEPRGTMCRSVIEAAKKGNIEILTSTFNLVEVCRSNKVTVDKIAAFFENDYILLVNLDRAVGERGRELMNAVAFSGFEHAHVVLGGESFVALAAERAVGAGRCAGTTPQGQPVGGVP